MLGTVIVVDLWIVDVTVMSYIPIVTMAHYLRVFLVGDY